MIVKSLTATCEEILLEITVLLVTTLKSVVLHHGTSDYPQCQLYVNLCHGHKALMTGQLIISFPSCSLMKASSRYFASSSWMLIAWEQWTLMIFIHFVMLLPISKYTDICSFCLFTCLPNRFPWNLVTGCSTGWGRALIKLCVIGCVHRFSFHFSAITRFGIWAWQKPVFNSNIQNNIQ